MMDHITPDWRGKGNVWEAYRRTCPPDTPARRVYSSYRDLNIQKSNALLEHSRNDPFTFVETVDDEYDFCEKPWAHYTQGHFFSDWRTVPDLYPVFSPSKAKGFVDIRIPSQNYYTGNLRHTYAWDDVAEVVKEIDHMEVPWDNKSAIIFWRGATTGGGSTPPAFAATFHRHRYELPRLITKL